ncbi:WLM-domain-containing protein [Trametes sanguinea]|nr:WLM-domain-containing protein [Trametes sanguinea]
MPDIFVKSFTHLKDRPHADKALPLLQRIASLVKPIMRKHSWVLPVLSEFFPESPNLLDINAGQKILVRLRPAHAPDTFYDEEDLVHTMLHELTHNVHGPHDEKFYKYLAELEEEYENLRKSGYAGEGFHSDGRRLGTNFSHNLPPHIARQKAVEAAERRKQISAILGGGGRLGGGERSNKSLRELAAEAAERRARDEKACASGAVAEAEAEKAARESVRDDVIDLTGDDSDHSPEPDILVVDETSPSSSSSNSTPGASTPATRPSLRPSDNSSGYSSSTSVSSGSRTPVSWSGLRPSSGNTSTSSLSSTGTTTPSSTMSSSSQQPIRPTVRRVERGAGPGTPRIPKPRSVSRPGKAVPPRSPATPPPTRVNSVAITRKHHLNGEATHSAHSGHAGHTDATNRLAVAVVPREKEWACPRCTLINDALALQCSACLLLRPGHTEEELDAAPGPDTWTCLVCGEHGMPRDFWTCRFCGSVKASS